MKPLYRILVLPALLLLAGSTARGQCDPIYIDGSVFIGAADNTQWYCDVTFGPSAQVYIEDGAAPLFYGASMTINPTAQFFSYPGLSQTGTGKVVFRQPNPNTATTVQQILNGGYSSGLQPALLNMEVDNPSGVSLSGSHTRISTGIQMTAGHIFLNQQDLVLNDSADISGYDASKFIVTNSTTTAGHLVKESYSGNFVFPVGRAVGDYTPASINNAVANAMHVLVQDYATSGSVEAGANGIDRTWNIYASSASGSSTINLQHNDATQGGNYNDTITFVTRWSSTSPNTTGQTALSQTAWQSNIQGPGTGTGSLTTGAPIGTASERSLVYTSFATAPDEAIAYYSKSSSPIYPLPVYLSSFSGKELNCAAVLNWTVTSAEAFSHFEVERSTDGAAYGSIATVALNSSGRYVYTDSKAPAGHNFYRLKMVDLNREARYSSTVGIDIDCERQGSNWTVFPNPASTGGDIRLSFYNGAAEAQQVRFIATTIAGQKIMDTPLSAAPGSNVYALPVQSWAQGLYMVRLCDDQGNSIGNVQKVVIR